MTATTSIINNKDLKPGMKIMIPAGDTLTINGEVYPSNISPGFIVAETEIGSLYLSGELTTKVLLDPVGSASSAQTQAALW
jgi:hypothetical protein